jgi:hypothetical protein
MFDRELAFFIANQADLVARFDGQVLLLRGDEIAGVYDSALAAYCDAQARFEPGSYMIQPCAPGPDAYTVTITSSEVVG